MSIERTFSLILLVCPIAALRKHSEMITVVYKSYVIMLVFSLDTFRLPMEMSKFR